MTYKSSESDVSSIIIQTLPPPTLTMNPPVITETDSVTLHCQTPPSVSVPQCYFYTLSGHIVRVFSCLKTLTGTELLEMSQQRSPAEVQVKCFYYGGSNSLHSDTSSITIHSQKPQMSLQHFPGELVLFICTLPGSANHDARCNLYFGEKKHPVQTTSWKRRDSKNRLLCQFTFRVDDFLRHLHFVKRHDASCDYSLGSESDSLSPRSDGYSLTDIVGTESNMRSTISAPTIPTDIEEKEKRLTQTMTTSTMTTGLTVGSTNTGSFISTSITPVNPTQETTWTWKLIIVVASLGGVILLGLAFLFTKRTFERCAAQRTQANVTDDLMCMRKMDHGGLLPAGNEEAYSTVTSVPAAVCLTGPEKLSRQESQNEDSDIYHVYSTISEEPPPSALKDLVYSTRQAY
ncbi:uncharacterized protein LOC134883078 isoform X2 [Eleginops maclovinus]|uniref:uncharacterized protein LOC134883078 isoform X2 n=1 Tax=Eleginops maclovinus TaxID=56733 RepID=UPI003080EEEE